MKEITHEDWLRNSTPREMWCWNKNEKEKVQMKVIFVLSDSVCMYPVFSVTGDDNFYETYKHCAEIEKQKTRRMTNKELSRWLREKPTREYKYKGGSFIYNNYVYRVYNQDEEVNEDIAIRDDYGEWREPLVEVEE